MGLSHLTLWGPGVRLGFCRYVIQTSVEFSVFALLIWVCTEHVWFTHYARSIMGFYTECRGLFFICPSSWISSTYSGLTGFFFPCFWPRNIQIFWESFCCLCCPSWCKAMREETEVKQGNGKPGWAASPSVNSRPHPTVFVHISGSSSSVLFCFLL